MDPLDLFKPNTSFKRVYMEPRTSQKYVPTNMDAIDRELEITNPRQIHERKEYAEEYVKAEERRMLEEASFFDSQDKTKNFDEVSRGTLPVMQEIQNEELTKIYKTYNFAYRKNESLTISSMQDKIISMIETNAVVIIQGPTGCGKTTQVPQFLLDNSFRKKVPCNIIVTQPRRIAAISIANRVSKERDWPIGSLVGFQVGMYATISQDTRLTYCTTGVLLRKLINSKTMLDYTHVILDEVHERSQEMDFLLLVVRKLLRTNSRQVKVILMSATIDVDKFASYFQSPVMNKLADAPIVDIIKRNRYDVNIFYLCQMGSIAPLPEVSMDEPRITKEMMQFCTKLIIVFDTIDKDSQEYVSGDEKDEEDDDEDDNSYKRHVVLVFLPGIYEIEEMHDMLKAPNQQEMKWDIVVMHSSITRDEQENIFKNPPKGYRRIILSTNISESSITVPDVKYVIDFCLTKQLVMNSITNFQSLELVWASKANCDQRAGRTGRVMAGRVYRLVPKLFYEEFSKDSDPEMLRAPLETLVLNAKLLDMGEPKELLALSMDPPDLSNLKRTIKLLKEVGALYNIDENFSESDGELTDLGRIMANLPVDIRISKLIALGHVFSILHDAIIMGATMATKNLFSNPFQKKLEAYNTKIDWADTSCSDCIASLNAYKLWQSEKVNNRLSNKAMEKKWAQRHFIQVRVLYEINHFTKELSSRLKNMGIVESVGEKRVFWDDNERALVQKIIIAGAFYPNYFVKNVKSLEESGKNSLKLVSGLDPSKTVFLQGWPVNQPGQLYAKRIQDLFNDCAPLSVEKIFVTFDNSSRIYIHFWNRERRFTSDEKVPDVTGRISPAVYRAVKLRKINTTMMVRVLDEQSSITLARKMKLINDRGLTFLDEKPSSLLRVKKNFGIRPVLPGLDITMIPLKITEILNPGHFWAQMIDDDSQRKLDRILRMINNDEKNFLLPIKTPPRLETLVFAPFSNEDKCFHRALIQSYKNINTANVLYVDCGKMGSVQVKDLRLLRAFNENEEQLIKEFDLPALAFECVLANIRPTFMSNKTGQWSPNARHDFEKLLRHDQKRPTFLFGEIYSVINSVVSLTLHCKKSLDNNVKPIIVNQYLIENNYAETCEEDYLSRLNHELRVNYDNLEMSQRNVYEEQQYDQCNIMENYPEPPNEKDCSRSILLRGPFSPLEIELMSLTKAGASKKINIEHSSVNSVLLDTAPNDPHDRLLVAAFVGESPSGRNLNLRDTTLMPNIPGLSSILPILFCPRMELRRSTSKGSYVGALCGLGIYPRNDEAHEPAISLFPEHDMEIKFDVEITNDDLLDINKLRHWMNLCLNIDGDRNEHMSETINCQVHVKNYLFDLMDRKRRSQTPEEVFRFNKWKLYDDSDFLQPGKQILFNKTVYPLHYALELIEEDEETKKLRLNQQELIELARTDMRNQRTVDTKCLLCLEQIFGIMELRTHLFSQKHHNALKKMGIE
ncbi:probable ATP-dependent RNA helicase spindle-E [Leptopilina boulardi]|uniref:probable ATP-dependent RNA helicase spindle-E n=1 Tax=Leptopilina boulardi TaxID=63433 RepID=UPI0021F5CD99|nr:probable ATP-dependent RNA helicase spindle-E [Leptopilina boulardi]